MNSKERIAWWITILWACIAGLLFMAFFYMVGRIT